MSEDTGEMLFDPTMKKKKKKKVINFEDFEVAAPAPAAEPAPVEPAPEKEIIKEKPAAKLTDDFDLDDFSNLKKKKKKKVKKEALDLDALLENLPSSETPKVEGETETHEEAAVSEEDTSEYTYDELLTRVFDIMRAKNPNLVEGGKRGKFIMKPPQVVRVGTKRTSFVNFAEICKILHRQNKHLLAFLLAELGTSGTVDGTNQLIIKGRFQQKHIENVLKRYIREYVTCHTCRSSETILHKETRLFFLQCETCGSRCSVQSIKSGFQAQTTRRALNKP